VSEPDCTTKEKHNHTHTHTRARTRCVSLCCSCVFFFLQKLTLVGHIFFWKKKGPCTRVCSLSTSHFHFTDLPPPRHTHPTHFAHYLIFQNTSKATKMPETQASDATCAICGTSMTGGSDFNSALPYAQGLCCWECNVRFVWPARLAQPRARAD